MVTMAQSAANWRNTHTHVDRYIDNWLLTPSQPWRWYYGDHTHVDRTHSLTTLTSTQLQPRCAKCQLSYWNQIFILKVPEEGSKSEYLEKTSEKYTSSVNTKDGDRWHSLLDQEQNEAGWHKEHGEDHAHRHKHVHSTVLAVQTHTKFLTCEHWWWWWWWWWRW